MQEERYRVLRFVAGLIEAFGWVVTVLGFLIGLVSVFGELGKTFKAGWEPLGWSFLGIPILLALPAAIAIVIGFPIIGFGQLIRVIIDIEAGTRATYEAIGQLGRELRSGSFGRGKRERDIFDLPQVGDP